MNRKVELNALLCYKFLILDCCNFIKDVRWGSGMETAVTNICGSEENTRNNGIHLCDVIIT